MPWGIDVNEQAGLRAIHPNIVGVREVDIGRGQGFVFGFLFPFLGHLPLPGSSRTSGRRSSSSASGRRRIKRVNSSATAQRRQAEFPLDSATMLVPHRMAALARTDPLAVVSSGMNPRRRPDHSPTLAGCEGGGMDAGPHAVGRPRSAGRLLELQRVRDAARAARAVCRQAAAGLHARRARDDPRRRAQRGR